MNVPGLAALALSVVGHQTFGLRRNNGSWIDGRWVEETSTVSPSPVGTVQPARGNDMLRLPEGRRNSVAIRIISRTELRIASGATATQADVVVWDGREWEVEQVQTFDGAFYDAIAVRLGD